MSYIQNQLEMMFQFLMCYVSTWFNAWSMEAIAFCIAVILLLIITLISFTRTKRTKKVSLPSNEDGQSPC